MQTSEHVNTGTTKPNSSSRRHGFSLLELAITVGIVMIVATLAVPSLSRYIGRYRLNTATHRLAEHIMLCRSMAISSNREYAIQFLEVDGDLEGNDWRDNIGSYRFMRGDRPRGSTSWEAVSLDVADAEGRIDLREGPGDVTGISLEDWTALIGPAQSSLPDALVFGAHGFSTNAPGDFDDLYVRVVLRNKASGDIGERRAVLADQGGNTYVVMPD